MLFRKLLLDYMSFFLIALFSASIVIWVFQAVNYLDIMIEDGRDYTVYISYSLLNFPIFVAFYRHPKEVIVIKWFKVNPISSLMIPLLLNKAGMK